MNEVTKFLELFPECAGLSAMCGGLETAGVYRAEVDSKSLTLEIAAHFARMPAPAEQAALEARIQASYGLTRVTISATGDTKTASEIKRGPEPARAADTVLIGKAIKGEPQPIRGITAESGAVIIRGEVFSVESKDMRRGGSRIFIDITDYTGSVRVSRFFRPGEDRSGFDQIKTGMYLTVQGNVSFDRYEGDIVLEPRNISSGKRAIRQDTAPEKRVELHLHTRYSNLDALTDPAAAVKRAAAWGHPAIAITDHGVAQAFPEAWKAGGKAGIKVIYGLEGYYVNDVDEGMAVHGESSQPLDGRFVALDVETPGLSPKNDRIISFGAVIFSVRGIEKSFSRYVNPNRHISPEITKLTGISDRDVFDAPQEEEALRSFLEFAGALPIVAHNADFDIAFVSAAAERAGIPFAPVYIDTLTLSRSLLPHLKRHKLDMVSRELGLPDFNHHRADDDAVAAAQIFRSFVPLLNARGAETIDQISAVLTREEGVSRRVRHIVLLVQNKIGLKNLYQLISKSYLEHYKRNPILPKSLLMQHREGILIGSACEAGEVFQAIVRGASKEELRRLASFYDYLEIQPICNNRFMLDNGQAADEEALRDFNRSVAALAKELDKPLIATGDVHFLDPEHEIYRHILLASRKFQDADRPLPLYFKTTDEMLTEFSYLGEQLAYDAVVKNPCAIAARCEVIELLPKDLYTPIIPNSKEDLERMVMEKAHALYGDELPQLVADRLASELDAILGRNYDVIYMSAQKLVADSLAHGYLVGSRGSVGSSLVAYMSGITEVNSLPPHYRCPSCRYSDFESGKGWGAGADMPDRTCPVCGAKLAKDGFDIPFETFLGFGGDKVPDIDLNFSGEYQANAHKYTETLFGSDHVFRAGTIGTLAEKTAYGYVKKYLEERGATVTKAEETRLALGLVGVKRTTGQHPGGLVIVPQNMDVTDFCPVQHPADDPKSGIITTHFEYHCMEANLLKLDELGHDDPTMIRMLEDLTGCNAREIPLDDPETMRIFRTPEPLGLPEGDPIIGKTGTIGIPEFGTNFTRQMLIDTQPTDFSTLVRLSGFSHGTDVWAGNIRELVLSGTATVQQSVGCRDDIMLYLIDRGMDPKRAFKFMEAVRKGAIHKGKPWPDGIVEEMEQLGVPEWWIESCRKIQYLFPKAHAVAYVMMAFRIAWFKVHEPLAFYSAYFYRRSQKDSFDAELMTSGVERVRAEIRRIRNAQDATAKEQDLLTTLEAVYEFYMRGFTFAPIDLYESDARRFTRAGEKALRPPFVAISGLGETAADDLMACRAGGRRFISAEELSDACPKVSAAHMEQLRALGALGDLPESSQMSLF